MDDLTIAKAIVERLTREQLRELVLHIENIVGISRVEPTQSEEASSADSSRLVVEFCESSAGSFGRALGLAKRAPRYSAFEENKKTWHRASWLEIDLQACLPLINSLSSLKNKRCLIDGLEQDWTELFGFASCAEDRARAYRPEHYCFGRDGRSINPWGCVQSRMLWSEWADWFTYGKFEPPGLMSLFGNVWVFDKARIRHELENNLFRFRFCPHMQTELIDAVIKALPDRIAIEKDDDWGYHESYNAAPGHPKIVQREKHDDFTITNEFYADGVKPIGLGALQKVLRKAFGDAGLPDKFYLEIMS